MIERIRCWLGYHKWLYADYVKPNDLDYFGPLNYVVMCPRCGRRKFWEGEK